jgi:hypothetical protein
LLFVNSILVLEGAVYRISTERFAGHPIVFSDSAAKLKAQTEMVDEALQLFTSPAEKAPFRSGHLQTGNEDARD